MPPLRERVALTAWLIKGVGAIVGLVAPTAALVSLGELPDYLAGTAMIILPALTAVLIIAIVMLGDRIAQLSRKKAATLILACAAGGAMLTIAYGLFTQGQVVGNEHVDGDVVEYVTRDIKPLIPSREIVAILDSYGGYREALLSPQAEELRGYMRADDFSAIMLILAMMTLAQLMIVSAIVGGAWWLAERHGATAPTGSQPAPSDEESVEIEDI